MKWKTSSLQTKIVTNNFKENGNLFVALTFILPVSVFLIVCSCVSLGVEGRHNIVLVINCITVIFLPVTTDCSCGSRRSSIELTKMEARCVNLAVAVLTPTPAAIQLTLTALSQETSFTWKDFSLLCPTCLEIFSPSYWWTASVVEFFYVCVASIIWGFESTVLIEVSFGLFFVDAISVFCCGKRNMESMHCVCVTASSMVISGLTVFLLWFVHERWQNVLMSCVFGAVSTVGFNTLDVLQTELFPTNVRWVYYVFAYMHVYIYTHTHIIVSRMLFMFYVDVNHYL